MIQQTDCDENSSLIMTTTPITNTLPRAVRKYMASIGKKGGSSGIGDAKRRDMKKAWETRRRNAERKAKEEAEVTANVTV